MELDEQLMSFVNVLGTAVFVAVIGFHLVQSAAKAFTQ